MLQLDNNDNVNIVQMNDQHSIIDKSISNCYHFNQMKQSNKKVNKINIMEIICDTFSIRGVARLRSRSAFLRGLWLCFVLIMTIGLLLTTYLLVQDYLLYDVSVNIHVALDTKSPFPALTICHHQPFSQNAYYLWRNDDVMSPSIFNKHMRNLTHTFLIDNDVDTAETLYQYDSLSIYYQNIKAIDAYRLGHDTTVFLNCMRRVNQTMQIEDNCMHMDGFQIRKFSHHIYFNCHTFEPKTKIDAYDTDTIALIVSLGIDVNYDNQHEQAFLVDLFEMARGLRVVVHEPGTYPDLEREGLHVEPGKLNEINYQPVLWKRLNTPQNPCREEFIDRNPDLATITKYKLSQLTGLDFAYAYNDLNVSYRYTQSQCILFHQQEDIIKECGCQYIYNPRPQYPSSNLPYCGSILEGDFDIMALAKRIQCLTSGPLNVTIRRQYETTLCHPRCRYYTYESTISVTTWRAVDWQLHWLRQLNRAFKLMQHDVKINGEYWNITQSKGFQQWNEYYKKDNLTNISSNAINDLNLHGDNFAYVVLKRRASDVRVSQEKLVLSISVLLSRIGGLCSLSIGLTAAFIVELIEFAYRLSTIERSNIRQNRNKNNNNNDNHNNNNDSIHSISGMYMKKQKPTETCI
ncbi:FMRFamide-activated amiloride-sensitive sodium channel [Schistosoma japonicum]|uniref:FMRFamide-activated amiloride-sensitive sodium channel n=1 Tax=Schistosoma japonicum TaxID=6182 RepID=A0A4Z2CPG2_SCHJA|nr:FMRFamide-activated amiloride-sensitive sodium channel [Schistosoma japonicum]